MKKIIAVGNAGGNIADSIRKQGIGVADTKFVYIDAESDSLSSHGKEGDDYILLTDKAEAQLRAITSDADTIIITAGLGGITGSFCAPVVAGLMKKKNVETVIAMVSFPFPFEGEKKNRSAVVAIDVLKEVCDRIIISPNGDWSLIPTGLATVITGFWLHVVGHEGVSLTWHNLAVAHIISGTLFLGLVIWHIRMHWGWYKSYFRNGKGKKSGVTMTQSVVFAVLAITGYILLFAIHGPNSGIGRFHYILGVIFTVIAIGHTAKRWPLLHRHGSRRRPQ